MAETKRMTCEQVVGYLLEHEGLDVLLEAVAWVVQQLMKAEVSELIGAAHDERASGASPATATARARRHPRGRDRAGDPEAPSGTYFPSFLDPRRRSEHALVSVVRNAVALELRRQERRDVDD